MNDTFFEYLGWVSLSPNLKESFLRALRDAVSRHHSTVEVEHLLFALVDDPEGAISMNELHIDRNRLRRETQELIEKLTSGATKSKNELQPSRELKKLMARTSELAESEYNDQVDGSDVIRALSDLEVPRFSQLLTPLHTEPALGKLAELGIGDDIISAYPEANGTHEVYEAQPVREVRNVNLGFDVDPIRTSIEAIMARRRDAETVLNQCEWYHLFKSLNMIEDGLEGEEQTHRAKLLARAERELAERPRCRKAFLFVQHLDKELSRLKGLVALNWDDEFSPDEAVAELSRLRARPPETKFRNAHDLDEVSYLNLAGEAAEIDRQLSHVKLQADEVEALEKQLERLESTASDRRHLIEELESHLHYHDDHSKRRLGVIDELERYLRSEISLSKKRDRHIRDLERELRNAREQNDDHIDRASNLEEELTTIKERAETRERLIQDLEEKLISEKNNAASHQSEIEALRLTLDEEKNRAEDHNRQVTDLQVMLEAERARASQHAEQIETLENDLKNRLSQLQAREEQIRILQQNLANQESQVFSHEEKLKQLEQDLEQRQGAVELREAQVELLKNNLVSHENEARRHEQEISFLRSQLQSLESRIQHQEKSHTVERLQMTDLMEQMKREYEEAENLVEIVHGPRKSYRINRTNSDGSSAPCTTIQRRSRPKPVPPKS